MIDAVGLDDAVGRRNDAMLLLIARPGLRPPELVATQLEDIDWRVGVLLIRGKGKLHDRVPVPVARSTAPMVNRFRIPYDMDNYSVFSFFK